MGHYILLDEQENTLVTREAADGKGTNSYPFIATTKTVKLRWYPATNQVFVPGESIAIAECVYLYRTTNNIDSPAIKTGHFKDKSPALRVKRGSVIDADPPCEVYETDSDQIETKKRTVVCFGDSIIGMCRDETSVTNNLSRVTGAEVYNVGFGGCRMSDHPSTGYAEFSMWALAKAISDGSWSAQEQAASQGSEYFSEQLAILKDISFDQVDDVIIHYGTNDFGGSVPIGYDSDSSDHATLCGALRFSIETLRQAYPQLKIYISLPVYRFWVEDDTIIYAETYKNKCGDTLPDAVHAIRKVAEEYDLPVIDGYLGLGVGSENAEMFLMDGTHLNEEGRRLLGELMGEVLLMY